MLQDGRSRVRFAIGSLRFFIDLIPEVDSTFNRNKYQEPSLRGKGARCVGLKILRVSTSCSPWDLSRHVQGQLYLYLTLLGSLAGFHTIYNCNEYSTTTTLRTANPRNCISILGRGKVFVSAPKGQDQSWHLPSLPFNGYRGSFRGSNTAGT